MRQCAERHGPAVHPAFPGLRLDWAADDSWCVFLSPAGPCHARRREKRGGDSGPWEPESRQRVGAEHASAPPLAQESL